MYIYPAENNRSISGILIFNDDKLPDTDAKIKFYALGFFGQRYYLGETRTDVQGKFKFEYRWHQYHFYSHKLVAEVIEARRPFSWHGPFNKQEIAVEKIPFTFAARQLHNDVGNCSLKYADAPTDVYIATRPYPGHMQGLNYFLRVRKAYLGELFKTVIYKICQIFMNVLHVQKLFDSFGPQYPKKEPTPENLMSELFNEISVSEYEETDTEVVWEANWDGLEFEPAMPKSLPNIKVAAEKNGANPLKLKYIEIKFREDVEPRRIKPEDSNLDWAIFVARSTFTLKGELNTHLSEGHLLPAIVGQTFFKYIKPSHPIFKAVAPHLSQIAFVNWVGAYDIIYGKESVLNNSALTPKAIVEMIIKEFKRRADYTKDIPSERVNSQDDRGKVSAMYYGLLLNYFRDFVEQNRAEIAASIKPIYFWSKSMHNRLKEIPMIVEDPNQFTKEDEERLIRCLTWVVHKTTFIHWATHSHQHLLTDIRMAAFGIKDFGLDKDGKLAPGGNVDTYRADFQLRIFRTILNFDADKLVENRYGDIDPKLIDILKANRDKFKPFDLNEIYPTAMI